MISIHPALWFVVLLKALLAVLEAAALQRRGIAGLEGLANYNTAAFNPYTGFQAGSADPYSGFQAGSADPFSGFQRQRGTEYTGFQAGAADPYSGFQAGSADPFSDFSAGRGREYTGFTAGEADAYGGFQAGRADPFSDFREAQFTAQTADQYDLIQPVSSVGQKYSSTWTHTCRMLWMFRSVRPVRTLAGAKQQEMQGQ